MRSISGYASGSFQSVIGEVVLSGRPIHARSNAILVTEALDLRSMGYLGCISSGPKGHFFHPDHVHSVSDLDQLQDGDIVRLENTGIISVLWEKNSSQNALLVTEACNCHCLMCPQPPCSHDPLLLEQAVRVLDLLRGKDISHICITGGEPTLLSKAFLNILRRCVREHPHATVDILTNGKTFADKSFARDVARIATSNVLFCVSLHSEIDTIHDGMVGAPGSYATTQQGIYHLATYGCRLEIRHVITRMNYNRLHSFAEHMYAYFPFCSHYALMGMELCGNAVQNFGCIAIDPHEYKQELRDAVLCLARRGLPVSVYNITLCQCDPAVWPFARQSISHWKNIYLPQCTECGKKNSCAGFFSTSVTLPAEEAQPMEEYL